MMAPLGRRTRAARRRAGETLDKLPTAATLRERYPEPPCGNLLPLDLLGLRWLGDSHNCGRFCSGARVDECQVLRSPFGESSSGSNARTVISTGSNLAQGAAISNNFFWPLCAAKKWCLTSLRARGRDAKPPFDRLRTIRRAAGGRSVFVFEFGFYFWFGVFVDDDFVGLELVGVAR